jgi:hypothetical protein
MAVMENVTGSNRYISAWPVARGVYWLQVNHPAISQKLGISDRVKRGTAKVVATGMAGRYHLTVEMECKARKVERILQSMTVFLRTQGIAI